MRTLKNRLPEYGMRRWDTYTSDAVVYHAIEKELDGPGCMRGYQAMWSCRCLKYGIQTSRDNVAIILRDLDLERTAL